MLAVCNAGDNDRALMHGTKYLTVNLIDRFLVVYILTSEKLKLIGVTAMFIANKYHEIRDRPSKLGQLAETEMLMLETLEFDLGHPTPYVFMRRSLKVVQSDEKLEHMSFFLFELSLVSYEMLRL
ncbi:G2/mitotic-specific cyclin-2-like [Salvia divinorum]|uniref:G2/mitotic-specific cyclin-2-like n=1 Tax=Salvia divinorum TaxID=28513 RepID=A0ABD1GXX7_SALDI